jgi:hypothetical protein
MNKDALDSAQATSSTTVKKSGSKHSGTLVKVKDYNPGKHTLKVVDARTGDPLEVAIDMIGESTPSKPFEQRNAKTLKTTSTSNGPIIEVTDDMASFRGSPTSGFFSTANHGNIIKGPISLEAAPHEIKLTGINTLNPLLTTGFASTIVTPIPTTIFSIPGGSMFAPVMKDIAIAATLIAAFGV